MVWPGNPVFTGGRYLVDVLVGEFFSSGTGAFLFAHIVYIIGFREAMVNISAWSLILLVIIAINSSRLLRRIIGAMGANRQNKLVLPVIIYGTVISILLYAATPQFTILPG